MFGPHPTDRGSEFLSRKAGGIVEMGRVPARARCPFGRALATQQRLSPKLTDAANDHDTSGVQDECVRAPKTGPAMVLAARGLWQVTVSAHSLVTMQVMPAEFRVRRAEPIEGGGV